MWQSGPDRDPWYSWIELLLKNRTGTERSRLHRQLGLLVSILVRTYINLTFNSEISVAKLVHQFWSFVYLPDYSIYAVISSTYFLHWKKRAVYWKLTSFPWKVFMIVANVEIFVPCFWVLYSVENQISKDAKQNSGIIISSVWFGTVTARSCSWHWVRLRNLFSHNREVPECFSRHQIALPLVGRLLQPLPHKASVDYNSLFGYRIDFGGQSILWQTPVHLQYGAIAFSRLR